VSTRVRGSSGSARRTWPEIVADAADHADLFDRVHRRVARLIGLGEARVDSSSAPARRDGAGARIEVRAIRVGSHQSIIALTMSRREVNWPSASWLAKSESYGLGDGSPLQLRRRPRAHGRRDADLRATAIPIAEPVRLALRQQDADGQFTSRLDIVSAMIDWWDPDTDRTNFDPGAGTVTSSGRRRRRLHALRRALSAAQRADGLDRRDPHESAAVGDDFWATFVEPNPTIRAHACSRSTAPAR